MEKTHTLTHSSNIILYVHAHALGKRALMELIEDVDSKGYAICPQDYDYLLKNDHLDEDMTYYEAREAVIFSSLDQHDNIPRRTPPMVSEYILDCMGTTLCSLNREQALRAMRVWVGNLSGYGFPSKITKKQLKHILGE